MNYTYILKCKDGTYYTGWTNDIEKRVKTHNAGRGAKYTKTRLPVELVYYETFESKTEAQKREYEIKQWKRAKKEALIKQGCTLQQNGKNFQPSQIDEKFHDCQN